MSASLKIFLGLFKKSLINTMILVFITFVIITIIPIVVNGYNYTLEKSLATKQPHITVKYIDEKTVYDKKELLFIYNDLQKYTDEFKITQINAFVESRNFIKLKSYGNNLSEFDGYVDAIGFVPYSYPLCYDFDSFKPVMLSEYGFKLTGIEMFDELIKNEQTMFFNESLYNAVEPLVTYEARFDMGFKIEEKYSNAKGNFMGVVEDYFDKPIVYVNYKHLNKILKMKQNHISGYMINIDDQKQLDIIKNKIDNYFNKDKKIVVVTTWREINKKQNDILKIFTQIGVILKWIILILASFAVTIYLYESILTKQPQLRLLNILGLRLINIINVVITMVVFISATIATYLSHIFSQYIINEVLKEELKIEVGFYIYDVIFSYIFLVLMAVIIINSMFKQNYNIFK